MDPARAWRNVVDFMRATPEATLKYEPSSGEWFIDLDKCKDGCLHHETLQGLSWQISLYKQSKIKPADIPVTPKAQEPRPRLVLPDPGDLDYDGFPYPANTQNLRRIIREEIDRKFPEQALMPWGETREILRREKARKSCTG
jgi:hypothetical protein